MKKNSKLVLLVMTVALAFTSCKKEVDIRDSAVGAYNGTITMMLLLDDGQLISSEEIFGKPESINNVVVSKDQTNKSSIKIDLDGDVVYGSKIAAASNAFTFDIEEQVWEGVKVSGYNAVEVGPTKYHGAFFNDTNNLYIGIGADLLDMYDEDSEEYMILDAIGAEQIITLVDLDKR